MSELCPLPQICKNYKINFPKKISTVIHPLKHQPCSSARIEHTVQKKSRYACLKSNQSKKGAPFFNIFSISCRVHFLQFDITSPPPPPICNPCDLWQCYNSPCSMYLIVVLGTLYGNWNPWFKGLLCSGHHKVHFGTIVVCSEGRGGGGGMEDPDGSLTTGLSPNLIHIEEKANRSSASMPSKCNIHSNGKPPE